MEPFSANSDQHSFMIHEVMLTVYIHKTVVTMDAGPTCDHAVPKALGLPRDCSIELNDIGMTQRVEDINLRGMTNPM